MMTVIEFDFEKKTDRRIDPGQVQITAPTGTYYWIHAEEPDADEFSDLMGRLAPQSGIDLRPDRHDDEDLVRMHPDCLALTFSETSFPERLLSVNSLHVILAGNFLATLMKSDSEIAKQVLAQYHSDFQNFAKSPGFLLFEVVDALCQNFQRTYRGFEAEVGELQNQLFEAVNERLFLHVARTTKQMLQFQFTIVDAREVIASIATRKSTYVQETTQPFLARKGELLGRMGDDLSTQRDAIANTLNLYVGFVSYRTNQIINRLTIISVIFLPLTFLVGVYGMNFTHMPEIDWPYSYAAFWVVVLVIVLGLLLYFRKKRWLQM